MRKSQPTTEHAEAVSRRLASLSAEIAAVRGEPSAASRDDQHTQIRPGRDWALGAGDENTVAPVVLPVPGRHASRRLSLGPIQLGSVHLAVVAVVAAIAVALASYTAMRDQAEPLPPPEVVAEDAALTPMSQSLPPDAVTPGATTSGGVDPAAPVEVTVDVAGKVRHPGIAVLPHGSRVVDALKAAGGARQGVDLTALNLARLLVDGEQILVGVDLPAGVAGTLGDPAGSGAGSGALVNINTADQTTLETLPGVGPVTAQAIMAWRSTNGAFTSVDELLEVKGIGDATLADLAPHVTI